MILAQLVAVSQESLLASRLCTLEVSRMAQVDRIAHALRGMRAIYIDAGTRDEWYLDLGAEAFVAELAEIGVTDVAFELFEGTHMAIDYRYPMALTYLAQRLSP